MDIKEKHDLFIVLESAGTWNIIWLRDFQIWLLIRITWRTFKIQISGPHPLRCSRRGMQMIRFIKASKIGLMPGQVWKTLIGQASLISRCINWNTEGAGRATIRTQCSWCSLQCICSKTQKHSVFRCLPDMLSDLS